MYTIFVAVRLSKTPLVNPAIDASIVFFTSIGFYRMLIAGTLWAMANVKVLHKLYWGKSYVDGLWSYTYTIDGEEDGKMYFGVWRFEQSLYTTSVVGFGLSDSFSVRSRIRSVTDFISNGAMREFINVRNDSMESAVDYYSRTSMFFERGKSWLGYPTRMRGKTIIYGGPRGGRVCNNVFVRHPEAKTEQDVIDEIKRNLINYGAVHPEKPMKTNRLK
ncbi:hypothetical protein [Ahniella affigens]|nr:hypothetical protein [Ahniella affigens]